MGDVVNQKLQHGRAVGGGQIRFLETGLGGRFANGAVGDAAESGDTLGNGVGLLFEVRSDGIKEFMELNEMQALDVPVGPLSPGCVGPCCRQDGHSKAQ